MFHIYLVGALCLPVHVVSRRRSRLDLGESGLLIFHMCVGIRPPHISHICASRTLDIDHSPRKATDENDAGIVVPDKACTAPPFRTPFARCSSFVSTPSALMVSALTIAARSFGRFRPPPLPSRVMVTCLCKRMRKKEVRNHKRRGAKTTCRLLWRSFLS